MPPRVNQLDLLENKKKVVKKKGDGTNSIFESEIKKKKKSLSGRRKCKL